MLEPSLRYHRGRARRRRWRSPPPSIPRVGPRVRIAGRTSASRTALRVGAGSVDRNGVDRRRACRRRRSSSLGSGPVARSRDPRAPELRARFEERGACPRDDRGSPETNQPLNAAGRDGPHRSRAVPLRPPRIPACAPPMGPPTALRRRGPCAQSAERSRAGVPRGSGTGAPPGLEGSRERSTRSATRTRSPAAARAWLCIARLTAI